MTTTSTESTIAAPEKVGNEFFVGGAPIEFSSITNLTNGGFVVSLPSGGGVALEVFDAMGTKVGEGQVSDTIIGVQGHSNITGLTNGCFVLTWTSGNGESGVADIKAQVFDPTGTKVGSEFLVNTTTVGGQNLSTISGLPNGGFVITWVDGSGLGGDSSISSIKAQVFDAVGGKVGGEFLVNTTTEDQQTFPTVTGLSNGGFVVTWQDNNGLSIKAQVFDDTGTKVGSEFLVNTTPRTALPTISALSDGGFVIAWIDGSAGNSDTSIKAQVLDAAGGKVGSEFLVNTTTAGIQSVPTISALSNGGFVIAWGDWSSGAPDVKAQVFDPTGAKVGNEFLVNTTTAGYQDQPTITGLSNGDVVVAWRDGSVPGIDLIKAQIFGFNSAPTIISNGGNDTATISITENTTAVTTVTATDPNAGQTLSYSISGGADAAKFTIGSSTGALSFVTAPNFETPTDAGGNNVYDVTVQVSDGHGGLDTQAIAVTVQNVVGVTINGTAGSDLIDATHTVAGQPLPTNEEDVINGGNGRDTINGLGGNDTLNGGANADTMIGGMGDDIYIVDNTSDVVTENLGQGMDAIQSSVTYTLSANVENLILIGSGNIKGTGNALDNAVTGNSGNNVLAGLAGADALDGGVGTDTATYAASAAGVNVSLATGHGGGGDAQGDSLINIENLTGSAFNDTLEGNAGNNVLAGGVGIDLASFEHSAAGVNVSLAVTAAQNTLGAGTDTLSGFENLTGSAFNDKLTGSSLANLLTGGTGNDAINGGAGNDTLQGGADDDVLIGGAGADALDGGSGNDTASYATATAAVTVSLVLQGGTQNTGGDGVDTLTGIENLIGSAFNDTLTGDAGNNVLAGGAGNDMLIGGIGNDTLDGGAGTADTASYATTGSGVTVNLALAGPQDTVGAGIDTLIGIEHLLGSVFNDTLTGDGLANRIDGGAGDDTIDGRVGNDILIGGANTAAGDTVSYAGSAVGVTVSLAIQDGVTAQNTLGAGTDTLSGFENLTGSAFNDTLTGNGLANRIDGGAGNDIINGGAGNDNLQGGAGTDTLKGGTGNDMLTGGMDADAFVFNTALNALTNVDDITDFEVGIDQIVLENSIFTKLAATGALSADFFHVGAGAADLNDFIIYDDATGALYYDSNGSASGHQVQFAHLDPGLALTHSDFFVI